MTTQPPPGEAEEEDVVVNAENIQGDEDGEGRRSGRCLPLTTTVFWTGAIAIDWEV